MRGLPRWDGATRAALALAAAGCLALVAAGQRLGQEPMSVTPPRIGSASAAIRDARPAPIRLDSYTDSLDEVAFRAAARNPFRADRDGRPRAAPPVPPPPSGAVIAPAPPPPIARVLGVAVPAGQGSAVAALQVGGSPPRLVRVGEEVGGFRVSGITSREVRLRSPAGSLALPVPSNNPR